MLLLLGSSGEGTLLPDGAPVERMGGALANASDISWAVWGPREGKEGHPRTRRSRRGGMCSGYTVTEAWGEAGTGEPGPEECRAFATLQAIKAAMRAAQECSTDECKVEIKLIAAPLYVLTTMTHNKKDGIDTLTRAVEAATATISGPDYNGELTVKDKPRWAVSGCTMPVRGVSWRRCGSRAHVAPPVACYLISDMRKRRVVSAEDERLLAEKMAELEMANQEVDGDEDYSEDEDEGMKFDESKGVE